MGRFKELEIPEIEPDIVVENLVLFSEEDAEKTLGYRMATRYIADAKSLLALIDLKMKSQRTKNQPHAA